ncbi:Protein kinase-like (PK-like) [Glarea lozoyensis ATCC 20868]|uniref:Protein kinase-like (PK-like) n=1 Tax=Glarea lozoyensis (strain ATCC 20868 / MF5171) TaxID=1116229 RepID=S3CNU8_GLAL2|nr:Protein kinase-like (PK-like) [Glarea lozoyensis ATCC 20868]EPE27400.1 Protein kinase-like (PK-like) [Glarea lozoyensis ATCC 20868]
MWEVENDDWTFAYTKIILREADRYDYAMSTRRYSMNSKPDIHELDLIPIPTSEESTRAPQPLSQDCYTKRPSLLFYEDTEGPAEKMCSLLLSEAKVFETLRAFPHPNIAKPLRCVVEDDKITGLCLVNYGATLQDRATEDSRPFDIDLCWKGIQQGIRHLHNLDLIRCDINPRNILMDGDAPVIIDLDFCHRKGEKLGIKIGTREWTNKDFESALPENDEYGFSKIRDFLYKSRKT